MGLRIGTFTLKEEDEGIEGLRRERGDSFQMGRSLVEGEDRVNSLLWTDVKDFGSCFHISNSHTEKTLT